MRGEREPDPVRPADPAVEDRAGVEIGGAFVGDVDDDRARALAHAHGHGTGAVIEGVRQEDLQDLPHRGLGERRRRNVGVDLDPQRSADRRELAVPRIFGLVQEAAHVEGRSVVVRVACEREEVVHGRLESIDRDERVLQRRAQIRTRSAQRSLDADASPVIGVRS